MERPTGVPPRLEAVDNVCAVSSGRIAQAVLDRRKDIRCSMRRNETRSNCGPLLELSPDSWFFGVP